ncbi:MAG: Gfo/Idh/MocA family protein [Calditrichaceae bacterium]
MIHVGVIGVGYWGPNIIRNFHANRRSQIDICCDYRDDRLDFIKTTYPFLHTTNDYKEVINDPKIDLVAICTPVFSHFELAKAVLEAGKHVLIEKPMTSNSRQAKDLIEIAAKKGLHIFVDHTFVYTGAVRKIKDLINSGELGELYYFDSVRVNLGLLQHDVNVLWDLAPHDISIMNHLLQKQPQAIVATGADHFGNGFEDVAYLTVYFPDNLIAHIHTNWLSPVKIRHTLIAGSKKMVVWDDNKPSEKVLVYDKGVDVVHSDDQVYDMLVQYRTGDMYCPKIDSTEALASEVDQIIDCLEENRNGFADGLAGLRVVEILEAAQKSIKNLGKEITI